MSRVPNRLNQRESHLESFNDLTLSVPLARAIADMGFEKPSPIQAETLPILLGQRTDFLGLAATGSGKTAAYGIPLLEKIDPEGKHVQALILCPTRELAIQVSGQLNLLGKHMLIKSIPVYGGASYGDQIRGLKGGAQIVVGTPGRLIDHLEKGTLKLDNVATVVLDEADEMISMGFKEDLETILQKVDKSKSNTWLFSATMSPTVRKVAHDYLVDPAKVEINRTEVLASTVEQIYFMTKESNKPEVLCKLIDAAEDFYGLIFCQTKLLVTELTQYLQDRGYRVDCLHGDKSQDARERTLRSFRDRKIKVLVCTDVASRGIDVKDISHVVNYSLPRELDNYVHRIGRTARAGKSGIAFSLVTPSHRQLVSRIEHRTKSRMTEGRIPNRKDIGSKKIAQFFATFQEKTSFAKAVTLLDEQWKTALAGMTTEEVAGRFLSILVPDVFQVDTDMPMMTRPPREDREQNDRGGGGYGGGRNGDRRGPYRPNRAGGGYGGGGGGGYSAGGKFGNKARGYDRGERSERPERAERAERPDFSERPPREERTERTAEPVEHFVKPVRAQARTEAVEQTERPARVERPRFEKPAFKKSFDRPARETREERPARTERPDRPRSTVRGEQEPRFVERAATSTKFKPRAERVAAAPERAAREPRVADADRPHVPFYERRARTGGGAAFGGPKARVKSGKPYGGKGGGFNPPKRTSGPSTPKRSE